MEQLCGHRLGQYHLVQLLGQGGMAAVYLARHLQTGQFYAVKVLLPALAQDPALAHRFRDEMRAMQRLQHPHILPFYDNGVESGYLYLVMAYAEGGSLDARLQAPLSPAQALPVLSQAALALDYAHGLGVVHRDVKPSNLLLSRDGQHLWLADFGLAKILHTSATLASLGPKTQGIIGTPEYMAPEQIEREEVDYRCDLYALGVVLYRMLTGRVPFRGENALAILFKHINTPPPLPRSLNPELPGEVEEVVLRAIDKEPERRFGSALELATALQQAMGGSRGAPARLPEAVGLPSTPRSAAPRSPVPRSPVPRSLSGPTRLAGPARPGASRPMPRPDWTEQLRRRPAVMMAIGVGLVLVLAVALGLGGAFSQAARTPTPRRVTAPHPTAGTPVLPTPVPTTGSVTMAPDVAATLYARETIVGIPTTSNVTMAPNAAATEYARETMAAAQTATARSARPAYVTAAPNLAATGYARETAAAAAAAAQTEAAYRYATETAIAAGMQTAAAIPTATISEPTDKPTREPPTSTPPPPTPTPRQ